MYKSHYSIATSTNTTTAAVDSLLARKIDNATAGLRPFLAKALCRLSEDNAGTITDYIQSLNEEINASKIIGEMLLLSYVLFQSTIISRLDR
jgi:hypothetical protein